MHVTADRAIAYERVGPLILTAYAPGSVTNATWREHLEAIMADTRVHGGPLATLSWAPSSGPSAAQRRLMGSDEFRANIDSQKRFALITENAMTRAIMTALLWFYKGRTDMRAFTPSERALALTWVAQVCNFERGRAEVALDNLIRATQQHAVKAAR